VFASLITSGHFSSACPKFFFHFLTTHCSCAGSFPFRAGSSNIGEEVRVFLRPPHNSVWLFFHTQSALSVYMPALSCVPGSCPPPFEDHPIFGLRPPPVGSHLVAFRRWLPNVLGHVDSPLFGDREPGPMVPQVQAIGCLLVFLPEPFLVIPPLTQMSLRLFVQVPISLVIENSLLRPELSQVRFSN